MRRLRARHAKKRRNRNSLASFLYLQRLARSRSKASGTITFCRQPRRAARPRHVAARRLLSLSSFFASRLLHVDMRWNLPTKSVGLAREGAPRSRQSRRQLDRRQRAGVAAHGGTPIACCEIAI